MSKSAWIALAALLAGCAAAPPVETAPPAARAAVEVPPPDAPVPPPAPVEAAPAPAPAEAPAPAAPAPAAPARPAQVAGGKYRVSVASEKNAADATRWVKKLEADGLHVQAEPVDISGVTWQRIVLPQLASKDDARAMVTYLDQALGIKGAWVIPSKPKKAAAPAAAATPTPPPAPAATAPAAPAPAAPAPAAPAPAEPAPPGPEHPQN